MSKMIKIVYNACYGGFGLSNEAVMRYAEIKGITLYSEKTSFLTHYYLCPPEDFNRIRKEEAANPVGPGRYTRSNAMYFDVSSIERTDPALVQVVEELGEAASDQCAKLCIKELPAGTLYRIDEYDGVESIKTHSTYDWKVA
jgi:hypothetical protein